MKLVDEAVRFLEGKTDSVQKKLNQLMSEASDALEFERAAVYRNRLWALAHVQATQGINPAGIDEADVFAAHQDGGQTCIQVFFFRNGQNWGNRAYFPRADKSVGVEEVLGAFIAQFYDDKPIARHILLSHDVAERALLAEALTLKAERKVEIAVPQRGEKRAVVEHALMNAREALGRRLADASSQAKLLAGVAEIFGLERTPQRVEVYDNSHIQGTNAVGAMIVAGPEGFVKNQYRKFNIKSETLTPGDDFAMMGEVLRRRFSRLVKEKAAAEAAAAEAEGKFAAPGEENAGDGYTAPGVESEDGSEDDAARSGIASTWPDVVFVDGGAGQLAAAHTVADELGLTGVALIGIAKGPDRNAGREHFFMRGRAPFMLEPRDPVLYFVQRMRDEAHRFAIGTHRAKRAKSMGANPLDEIAGIGPSRKRALLKHFGSAKAVSGAGVEDLQAVSGISSGVAQLIYDFFHERRG
jgi:excinuclease ABC subunit C